MDQREPHPAAGAVRARERGTGTQHPANLGEEAILGVGGGHVVEHREAGGAAEAGVLERHVRAVALHDLHSPAHPLAQRTGEHRIDLQRREPPGPGGQHLGGRPEARAHLEHVRAQVHVGDGLRHQVLAHVALPSLAVAVPVVEAVHSSRRWR